MSSYDERDLEAAASRLHAFLCNVPTEVTDGNAQELDDLVNDLGRALNKDSWVKAEAQRIFNELHPSDPTPEDRSSRNEEEGEAPVCPTCAIGLDIECPSCGDKRTIGAYRGRPIPCPECQEECDHSWEMIHPGSSALQHIRCEKCGAFKREEWPETTEEAIKILREGESSAADDRLHFTIEDATLHLPTWESSPDPTALDLNITALPGEQVAVEAIRLIRDLWADMTPEQKTQILDWLIEDQKKWRDFWEMGG